MAGWINDYNRPLPTMARLTGETVFRKSPMQSHDWWLAWHSVRFCIVVVFYVRNVRVCVRACLCHHHPPLLSNRIQRSDPPGMNLAKHARHNCLVYNHISSKQCRRSCTFTLFVIDMRVYVVCDGHPFVWTPFSLCASMWVCGVSSVAHLILNSCVCVRCKIRDVWRNMCARVCVCGYARETVCVRVQTTTAPHYVLLMI